MISDDDVNFYRKNSYLIKRDAVPRELLEPVIHSLVNLFKSIGGRQFEKFTAQSALGDQEFHDAMIDYRKDEPRRFGAIYDTMQSMATVHRLTSDATIVQMAARLVGAATENLTVGNFLCRLDAPHDTRNALDWHQDVIFDDPDGNEEGRDGVTAWMPMMPVNEMNGSIHICVGSHNLGRLSDYPYRAKRADDLSSEVHRIPDQIISQHPEIVPEADVGDVVFIPLNAIHRSGDNRSTVVRTTVQGRYFDTTSEHFVPGKLLYQRSQL